jgi:hypothetical protein
MAQKQNSTNSYNVAKWVVSADPTQGSHTTITSALASASAGDSIFILPGTYTENPPLKTGVSIQSFTSNAASGNVIINGTCTYTGGGTVAISGVELQTNSNYFLSITGSTNGTVYLNNCNLNCLNNTGINNASTGTITLVISSCAGNIGTVATSLFTSSSPGTVTINLTQITNTAGSIQASSISAGSLIMNSSTFSHNISTTGTAGILFRSCAFNCAAINAVALTVSGTGTSRAANSTFIAGTATAINISGGSTLELDGTCSISSTATNVISGTGTLEYSNICFAQGSSYGINTTTITPNTSLPAAIPFLFTPALAFGGASTGITYTAQEGKAYQLGPMVFFDIVLLLSNKGTATGNATITGFPLAAAATYFNNFAAFTTNVSFPLLAESPVFLQITPGATTGSLICGGTTVAQQNITNTQFTNTSDFYCSGFYFAF